MASRNSEQSPGSEFISRLVKNSYLKKSSSFTLILFLCGGWVVCTIRCATETAPGCCSSRLVTRSAIAAPIPAKNLEACQSHSPKGTLPQRQLTVNRQKQNLSKPGDGSHCYSCEAQTNGRAVLLRLINNWPIDTNIPCRSALYETANQLNQMACIALVMNRGSTYLRCCALLI